MSNQDKQDLETVSTNLNRMRSALASNNLSGLELKSDAAKTALSALLAESVSGEFRPDIARETIKKVMKLG